MKRYLKELVLLLAVFGGLPFDTMSDSAYAQTAPLRLNGVKFGNADKTIYVTAYCTTIDGVTDNTTCIGNAVTAWTGNGSGTLIFPAGSYVTTATILFPMASNGRYAMYIDPAAQITYSGSGWAIDAAGTGQAYDNLKIYGGGRIVGSSAGAGGIRLTAFNRGTLRDLNISGFTTGDGILVNGANSVDIVSCQISGNKNGIHSMSTTVSAINYAPNANRVIGGHIGNNSNWGLYEDATGTGGAGLNNVYTTAFDPNGGNTVGGNVFIQGGSNMVVSSYLEYSNSQFGPYNIAVGDGTYTPKSTIIENCLMGSVSATSSIYDNGQGTVIANNIETSTATNFITGGTAGTARFVGKNLALAVGSLWTGTDNGDTLDLGSNLNLLGSLAATATGVSFRSISGLGAPLSIRARAVGDTVIANLLAFGGGNVGNIATSGAYQGGHMILSPTGLTADRTFTWPDRTDTVATLGATQTFTATTMTTPTLTTPVISAGLTASGSASNNFSGSTGSFVTSSGTNTMAGSVVFNSAIRPHRVTVADAGYSALGTDTYIGYTSITAARTVTLNCANGTSAAPQILVVKDESGSATGVNTITLSAAANVDGAATKVCVNSAFGSCRVYSNGTTCFTW